MATGTEREISTQEATEAYSENPGSLQENKTGKPSMDSFEQTSSQQDGGGSGYTIGGDELNEITTNSSNGAEVPTLGDIAASEWQAGRDAEAQEKLNAQVSYALGEVEREKKAREEMIKRERMSEVFSNFIGTDKEAWEDADMSEDTANLIVGMWAGIRGMGVKYDDPEWMEANFGVKDKKEAARLIAVQQADLGRQSVLSESKLSRIPRNDEEAKERVEAANKITGESRAFYTEEEYKHIGKLADNRRKLASAVASGMSDEAIAAASVLSLDSLSTSQREVVLARLRPNEQRDAVTLAQAMRAQTDNLYAWDVLREFGNGLYSAGRSIGNMAELLSQDSEARDAYMYGTQYALMNGARPGEEYEFLKNLSDEELRKIRGFTTRKHFFAKFEDGFDVVRESLASTYAQDLGESNYGESEGVWGFIRENSLKATRSVGEMAPTIALTLLADAAAAATGGAAAPAAIAVNAAVWGMRGASVAMLWSQGVSEFYTQANREGWRTDTGDMKAAAVAYGCWFAALNKLEISALVSRGGRAVVGKTFGGLTLAQKLALSNAKSASARFAVGITRGVPGFLGASAFEGIEEGLEALGMGIAANALNPTDEHGNELYSGDRLVSDIWENTVEGWKVAPFMILPMNAVGYTNSMTHRNLVGKDGKKYSLLNAEREIIARRAYAESLVELRGKELSLSDLLNVPAEESERKKYYEEKGFSKKQIAAIERASEFQEILNREASESSAQDAAMDEETAARIDAAEEETFGDSQDGNAKPKPRKIIGEHAIYDEDVVPEVEPETTPEKEANVVPEEENGEQPVEPKKPSVLFEEVSARNTHRIGVLRGSAFSIDGELEFAQKAYEEFAKISEEAKKNGKPEPNFVEFFENKLEELTVRDKDGAIDSINGNLSPEVIQTLANAIDYESRGGRRGSLNAVLSAYLDEANNDSLDISRGKEELVRDAWQTAFGGRFEEEASTEQSNTQGRAVADEETAQGGEEAANPSQQSGEQREAEKTPKSDTWEAMTPSVDKPIVVKGHYQVVDLSELKFVDVNDKAQQDEQERNRSGRRTLVQVAQMLSAFVSERLTDDKHTDRGAPIYRVLEDGTLRSVSGEGRSRLLREVYDSKGEAAKLYREQVEKFAAEHGIKIPEGVKNPVLLRIADDTGGLSWAELAKASNADMKSAYSEVEEAHADARELPKIIHLLNSRSGENILEDVDFCLAFAEIVGAGTKYTQDRKQGFKETLGSRIENALVAFILNDRETATELFDSPLSFGSVLNTLRKVSVDLVRLKDNEKYNISGEISTALKAAVYARNQKSLGSKLTPTQLIEQFFMQETLGFEKSPKAGVDVKVAERLANLMVDKKRSLLGKALIGYVAEVERENGIDGSAQSLFGEAGNISKAEMLSRGEREQAKVVNDGDVLFQREESSRGSKEAQREAAEIERKAKENGTWMKAPNGKPTKLSEKQWVQVRTKAFKKWFGDWEHDAENASKVVDENGEPLVVYHGTNWKALKEKTGDAAFKNSFVKNTSEGAGFYFTKDKSLASGYGEPVACFLNLKNPKSAKGDLLLVSEEEIKSGKVKNVVEENKARIVKAVRNWKREMESKGWEFYDEIDSDLLNGLNGGTVERVLDNLLSTDGFIKQEEYDSDKFAADVRSVASKVFGIDGYVSEKYGDGAGVYVAFRSEQIKSATDNTGAFDASNPDIRFSAGEEAQKVNAGDWRSLLDVFKSWLPGVKVRVVDDVEAELKGAQERKTAGLSEEQKKEASRWRNSRFQIVNVYHGSPHRFTEEPNAPIGRFRDDKMGTGEGAQSFGWGHYLTAKYGIAKGYAQRLARRSKNLSVSEMLEIPAVSRINSVVKGKIDEVVDRLSRDGVYEREELEKAADHLLSEFHMFLRSSESANVYNNRISSWISRELAEAKERAEKYKAELDDAKKDIVEAEEFIAKHKSDLRFAKAVRNKESSLELIKEIIPDYSKKFKLAYDYEKYFEGMERILKDALDGALVSEEFATASRSLDELRNIYTVEFDDSKLLDWKSGIPKDVFESFLSELRSVGEEKLARDVEEKIIPEKTPLSELHDMVPNAKKVVVSKALWRTGVVGHRFPAQSFGSGDYSKGTNYVIYSGDDLKIVDAKRWMKTDENSKVLGWYDSNNREVVVGKGANAGTIIHELGWHATFDWARENSPELYQKMKDYAESAPEEVKARVRELYGEDLSAEVFMDEVGAMLFTQEHAGKLDEVLKTKEAKTWWAKVKRLFSRIWKSMISAIGGNNVDINALAKMTPQKAMNALAEAFVDGKTLGNVGNTKLSHSAELLYQRAAREQEARGREQEARNNARRELTPGQQARKNLAERARKRWQRAGAKTGYAGVVEHGAEVLLAAMLKHGTKINNWKDDAPDAAMDYAKRLFPWEEEPVLKDMIDVARQAANELSSARSDITRQIVGSTVDIWRKIRESTKDASISEARSFIMKQLHAYERANYSPRDFARAERFMERRRVLAQQGRLNNGALQMSNEELANLGVPKFEDFKPSSDTETWVDRIVSAVEGKHGDNEPMLLGVLRKTLYGKLRDSARRIHNSTAAVRAMRILDDMLARGNTKEQIIKMAKEAEEVIRAGASKQSAWQLREKILRMTEPFARFSPKKVEKDRITAGLTEMFFYYFRNATFMPATEIDARIKELNGLIESKPGIDGGDTFILGEGDRKMLALVQERAALTVALKYREGVDAKDAEILSGVLAILEERRTAGDRNFVSRLEKAEEDAKKIADTIAEAIVMGKKNRSGEDTGSIKNAIGGAFTGALSLKQQLLDAIRHCPVGKVRDNAIAMIERLDKQIADADLKKSEIEQRNHEWFCAKICEIFGDGKKVLKSAKARASEASRIIAKLATPNNEYKEFSASGDVALSYAQVLQIYSSVRQEDVQISFKGLTPEEIDALPESAKALYRRIKQIPKLKKAIGEAGIRFLDECGDKFMQEAVDIDRVAFDIAGVPLTIRNKDYFPIVRDFKKMMVNQAVGALSYLPSVMTPRTQNRIDIDENADVFSVFLRRNVNIAHFLAFGNLHMLMGRVMANDNLSRNIVKASGASMRDQLLKHVRDILSPKLLGADAYATNPTVNLLTTFAARVALGANLLVALRQVGGLPAFAFEAGWRKTMMSSLSFAANPIAAIDRMKAIINSPGWTARYGNNELSTQLEVLRKQGKGRLLSKFFQVYMATNKYGDAVPVLIFGQGIYAATQKELVGKINPETGRIYTQEEIDAQAMSTVWDMVEKTQQTSRTANMSTWQRSGQAGLRLIAQFQSSTAQFLAAEVAALRQVYAQPKSKEAWKKLGSVLFTNHVMLPGMYVAFGVLWKAMFGDDDDDFAEAVKQDFITSCILGPASGIFVLGSVITGLASSKKGYQQAMVVPAYSVGSRVISGIGKIADAISDEDKDGEDLLKAINKLGRVLAPVRDVEDIFSTIAD